MVRGRKRSYGRLVSAQGDADSHPLEAPGSAHARAGALCMRGAGRCANSPHASGLESATTCGEGVLHGAKNSRKEAMETCP
eukprot:4365472-Pleurochrysis_carterae.AAC.1